MCRILREASHHGRVKLCWIRGVIEMKWYAHERAHEIICAWACAWNNMRTSVRKYRKCDKKRKTKNSQRKIRNCRQSRKWITELAPVRKPRSWYSSIIITPGFLYIDDDIWPHNQVRGTRKQHFSCIWKYWPLERSERKVTTTVDKCGQNIVQGKHLQGFSY